MSLVGTFDETPRMKKLVKGLIKVIEKYKEKLFLGMQKPMQTSYRTCMQGVNKKLKECGLELKINI